MAGETTTNSESEIGVLVEMIRLGDHVNAYSLLRQVATRDERNEQQHALDDPSHLLRSSVAAEIYDHLGAYNEAREQLALSEPVWDSLRLEHSQAGDPTRIDSLTLERCRYLVQGAVSSYRLNECDRACKYLLRVLGVLKPADLSTIARHLELRVQSLYWLGHVRRRQQKYREAIRCYQHAICDAGVIAEIEENAEVAQYLLGSCLGMGLGWTQLVEGNLEAAESELLAAKGILCVAGKDELRRAHTTLLLAGVHLRRFRPAAGNSHRLDAAILLLEGALEVFRRIGHRLYSARAKSELSVANFAKGAVDAAYVYATDAMGDAEQSADWESWSKALLVQSRVHIERSEFARALDKAFYAEQQAQVVGEIRSQIESCLTRGEVRVRRSEISREPERTKELQRAAQTFLKAKRLCVGNIRQEGACDLHLARTFARLKNVRNASLYLDSYNRVAPSIEDGSILDLADNVRRELCTDVIILSPQEGSEQTTYLRLESQLRCILIDRIDDAPEREEAIRELGISRQTYFNWRSKRRGAGLNPQSASPSEEATW